MAKSYQNLASAIAAAALSACSSGGSGTATPTATTSASVTPPTPTAGPPQDASLRGSSPLIASGSTPNFTTGLPANGTVFPLDDSVLQIAVPTNSSVTGYTNSLSGGTTLTFQGTQIVNGVTKNVFSFKEPGLSVDAPNLIGNSSTTLPDGRQLTLITTVLNYALLGYWSVSPPQSLSGTRYLAYGFTGYQTPTAGVPTSGTASYAGSVSGQVFVPGGPSTEADLNGQANVTMNFSAATVAGSLANMTSFTAGESLSPAAWNNVALSGKLSGATVQGTTSVTNSPSDGVAMGSGAKGTFVGALFGPNGEELGIGWNLYDPSGNGKAAIGTLGATKQ